MANVVERIQLRPGDGVLARWRAMPVIVRLYFSFALVATALLLSIVYSKDLHEGLIQWTSWGGLFCYSFGAIGLGRHVLTGSKSGLQVLPIMIAAFAAFGLIEHLIELREPDRFTETNPYLEVHPWRPLVTVALPDAWALLLYLPTGSRPGAA